MQPKHDKIVQYAYILRDISKLSMTQNKATHISFLKNNRILAEVLHSKWETFFSKRYLCHTLEEINNQYRKLNPTCMCLVA